MLYSDVEGNSVLLLIADDDTTSTVSPTRRGGHEKTHGCGTAGETYMSPSKCGCFGSVS